MDLNMICLSGTVIDCPKPLRTGNNVILSLRVYFLPEAFRRSSLQEESQAVWWNEGSETMDEQMLRERKESLGYLFEAVSLRPTRSSSVTQKSSPKPEEGAVAGGSKGRGKAKIVEVIGDDEDAEEVEVEGEELDDQQVSLIYKKCRSRPISNGVDANPLAELNRMTAIFPKWNLLTLSDSLCVRIRSRL